MSATAEPAGARPRRRRRERVNPPAEELYRRKWRIFGVMMVAWAMSLLDVSIVNIAIPELERKLDSTLATVSWVANGYNLAFAVLLVMMGRLADQFGRRRFFVIGLAVFTLGSALCAASPTIGWLVGFRILQGAGAGIIAPLGFAMTVLVFPPKQRGLGLAMIAIVALVFAAAGPVLGGILIELLSWHWIFIINLPFGVLAILLALRWWPETWDLTASRHVDWLGMGLLGGAVTCLTFGLVEANSMGWTNPIILFLLQFAILLAIGFAVSQRFGRHPMLGDTLTRNVQFVRANGAMLLFGAGSLGMLLLLSLIFINLWAMSPIQAGLALAPVPLCGLASWPLVGRTADKRPPSAIAVPGLVVMAAGMVWMSFALQPWFENLRDYLWLLPGLLGMGVGMGTVFPALNVGAMGAVHGQELGLASGIVNTSRQIGAAIGIAILIAAFGTIGGIYVQRAWDNGLDDYAEYTAFVSPQTTWGLIGTAFTDFAGGRSDHFRPQPGYDRHVTRVVAGAARDGFAWAIRLAAILVLLAVLLARSLSRTPAMARAAEARAAQARAQRPPPEGAGVPGGPGGAGEPPAPHPGDARPPRGDPGAGEPRGAGAPGPRREDPGPPRGGFPAPEGGVG